MDRQTDTQMAVANIHFALAISHAKCNSPFNSSLARMIQVI